MARPGLRRRSWEAALHAGDLIAIEQRFLRGVKPAGVPLLLLAVRTARNEATLRAVLSHVDDLEARDAAGCTALHYVRRPGFTALLLDTGADFMARNAAGQTPLHVLVDGQWRASFHDDELETIELLLERGADPNACDAHGRTPLHSALAPRATYDGIASEWAWLMESSPRLALSPALLLRRFGARLDLPDREGVTPAELAASAGVSERGMKLLRDRRAPYR